MNYIVTGVASDVQQLCINTVLSYYEILLKDKGASIITVWEEHYTCHPTGIWLTLQYNTIYALENVCIFLWNEF